MKAKFIFALFALVSLAGCKKYSVECELVAQPRVMISSGSDPMTPAYMARVYVFYVDEREYLNPVWIPGSYVDAEAGIVRHRSTGQIRPYNLVGAQGDDDFVHLTLTKSPMVLVAVDPVNKFYAWKMFKYELPLEKIYVPVSFKIYQKTPYKDNDWIVISETDENTQEEEQEDSER